MNQQLEYLEKKINDYQQALDEQDAADDKSGKGSLTEDDQLPQKRERLRCKQEENKVLPQQLKDSGKERVKQNPEIMKKPSATVEHPFGTLKHRAGMNHFLMRGLEKCRGEFSLMVLGYNFTRVLNILDVKTLRGYCAQRSGFTLKNA